MNNSLPLIHRVDQDGFPVRMASQCVEPTTLVNRAGAGPIGSRCPSHERCRQTRPRMKRNKDVLKNQGFSSGKQLCASSHSPGCTGNCSATPKIKNSPTPLVVRRTNSVCVDVTTRSRNSRGAHLRAPRHRCAGSQADALQAWVSTEKWRASAYARMYPWPKQTGTMFFWVMLSAEPWTCALRTPNVKLNECLFNRRPLPAVSQRHTTTAVGRRLRIPAGQSFPACNRDSESASLHRPICASGANHCGAWRLYPEATVKDHDVRPRRPSD